MRRDGDRVADLAAGSRVVVSVELAGGGAAVQLKGSSSQQLRLDPSQTTEVVFEMEAVALGSQKLVARVSEEGASRALPRAMRSRWNLR